MKKICSTVWIVVFVLSACDKPAQAVPPTIPSTSTASQKSNSTSTNILSSETPSPIAFTLTVADATADPTIFGAIGIGEIQAFALESVANAIFNKTMDGFITEGRIQEYQVTGITIFPGNNGLLSEITFNVRTTDPEWVAEGGTPAADNWLNGKCYRFDFFTTDTEYQLKNQRLCA